MAGHHLIDAYLAELARRLPTDVVDELADGLHETWRQHLEQGLAPTDAARAAIAEFGSAAQVSDAFVAQASGRTTARLLLATGPIVGAAWASTLLAARAWTWPVPAGVVGGMGVTLLGVVACLIAAATTRHGYGRTRLGHVAAVGVITLDVAMLVLVLLAAPLLVWPMAIAIPASLTRIAMALRRMPRTAVA